MFFQYGEKETEYLKKKDKRLAEVIGRIGPVQREVDPDLFSSVVHQMVGQQISMKAQATVWNRMLDDLKEMNAETVLSKEKTELQAYGISMRKAECIHEFAEKVQSGELDLQAVYEMTDEEAIAALSSLKGVGIWTAEMILLFCMQRPDVFSYRDLGIQRGLCMLYHHRKIDKKLFEKYRKRYSPYGSVASLYLWEVAGGAIPEMREYAPGEKKKI